MTDPLQFPSLTPRFHLPLLFAGQAQKEVSVNAAHALMDVLLHCAVSGESGTPPVAPEAGECWLVAAPAQGAFAGREGCIACYVGEAWTFATPQDGMRVFDRSTSQFHLFRDGWHREDMPDLPTGGVTIDLEARAAIGAIVALLQRSAMLPTE